MTVCACRNIRTPSDRNYELWRYFASSSCTLCSCIFGPGTHTAACMCWGSNIRNDFYDRMTIYDDTHSSVDTPLTQCCSQTVSVAYLQHLIPRSFSDTKDEGSQHRRGWAVRPEARRG